MMFDTEQQAVEARIKQYCDEIGLDLPELHWVRIPFSAHWGISTSFFQMAAQEARQGKKVNVPLRAQEIASLAADHLGIPQGFEKTEAVKGYLNLYFNTAEYARRVADQVLTDGDDYGRGPEQGERVMVEFSQPNTHKAFHVGHLRNVILGDAVCRQLDFAGFDVVRANYIGDIGLHVIKWLWNYQKFHAGEQPGEDKTRWMGDLYAEADRRFEESETNQAEVRALFGRWDQGEAEIVKLWEQTRQWSMEGFEQVYDLLDVRFDHLYYESEVEHSGKELVNGLIQGGIARDERPEGAVIIPLDEILGTNEKYRVLVILRSDGTSLYSTKDIPLAIKKFEQYQLDRSVYVIDVRQSLYMQQIYKTLELMGYEWAKNLYHLAYEIVNLPGNVTMSSRDGTVVLLEDLVREATARALEIVQTKNPELSLEKQQNIAQAVALGALKYSMLSRDNTKVVTFDWEAALDFNGQAAPYIQYAYVRCGSILRRYGKAAPSQVDWDVDLEPAEIALVEMISRLPDEVQRAAREYRPMLVANLSFEMAQAFSDFYNQCPVLKAEEPIRSRRLRMVAVSRQVLRNCLYLLGISAPEAM